MRYVKLSEEEVLGIGKTYESILSTAAYGLLSKKGETIGKIIAESLESDDYFDEAAEEIKNRGWVEDIEIDDNTIRVKGSIEANNENSEPSCHILKGILKNIYSQKYHFVKIDEVECVSEGKEMCVFKVTR